MQEWSNYYLYPVYTSIVSNIPGHVAVTAEGDLAHDHGALDHVVHIQGAGELGHETGNTPEGHAQGQRKGHDEHAPDQGEKPSVF